jgi:REP element-mobilizing transposase RayT
MSHLRREAVPAKCPVHITLRVRRHVMNLRTRRAWEVVAAAVAASQQKFGFQVVLFTVMGNHLHLICEAQDRRALAKGVQALEIRIAMRLNRMMGTKGAVFSDRYHAEVLRSATQVAHTVAYVRNQYRHHFPDAARPLGRFRDPYSRSGFQQQDLVEGLVRPPRTTLLAHDWKFVRTKGGTTPPLGP